jgi:hypothetical protein
MQTAPAAAAASTPAQRCLPSCFFRDTLTTHYFIRHSCMPSGHSAVLANNWTMAAARARSKQLKITKLVAHFRIKIYVSPPNFLYTVRVAIEFAYNALFLFHIAKNTQFFSHKTILTT